MSKKKRRLKKRIKQSQRRANFTNQIDRHHLLWIGSKWNQPWAKRLRLNEWLIVPIPKNTLHFKIHQYIKEIPVPDENICKMACSMLEGLDQEGKLNPKASLEDRLRLLIFLFQGYAPKTAKALEDELYIVSTFYSEGH